jgi:hypothetical protein
MGCLLFRVLFSGNANNSANVGLAYANTNNTATNANTNISSQLCSKILKRQKPWRLPKNKNVNRVLVGSPKIPFEPAK